MTSATAMPKVYNFKLVLLGDSAVGKSSTVERFVKNEFFEYNQPTIGAAFLTQTLPLETHTVKFEIWDTAGQERYRSLAPMYYRGAAAACIVYDITNRESLSGAKTWITELRRQVNDIVIALAGNKCDLSDRREISTAEVEAYAREHGLMFYEISAKTGANVRQLFEDIAKRLPIKASPAGRSNVNERDRLTLTPDTTSGYTSMCCR